MSPASTRMLLRPSRNQSRLLPAQYFWDPDFYRRNAPAAVRFDRRPGASPGDFWWTGDGDQVGAFWYAYTSAWLPASLLQPQNQARLVDAWFAASRHWGFEIVFNKGLSPVARIERSVIRVRLSSIAPINGRRVNPALTELTPP